MAEPFYRKFDKKWYVRIRDASHPKGKDIALGKKCEPDDLAAKAAAWAAYYAIMKNRQPVTSDTTVAQLLGKFLTWTEKNKKPLTYAFYKQFLTSFVEHVGEKLTIADVKPRHVVEWRDSKEHEEWSRGTRRCAVVAVKRAFNWAADPEQELIPSNPVAKVKPGASRRREVYIDADQWRAVLSTLDEDDPFREFLSIMRATGCRPQEARLVECRHVDLTAGEERWVFPVEESKCGDKTDKKRMVLLEGESLDITRLAYDKAKLRAGGKGRLFVNRKGQPFTLAWINTKTRRITAKLQKQYGPDFRFFPYALRHSWITDKLKQRVDVCTVAELAGNSPEMVMKVYNQLGLDKAHQRAELRRASTGNAKREAS